MRVEPSQTLRARLRASTAADHDRLDALVAGLTLADPAHYAAFLGFQLRARAPIERWAERECPADLRPPPGAALIVADLHDLGAPVPSHGGSFAWPAGADPLGLAWALAGSHLGNRAILAQLDKVGARLPTRFLGDADVSAFWRGLRPRLEVPASAVKAEAARGGAVAVFAAFLDAAILLGRAAA